MKKQPEEHVHVRWVPSQGTAPALQEVAGGITTFSGSPGEAKSLADGGRVRILALMADERSPAFPDVPTLKEFGVNWAFTNWFALVAPKGRRRCAPSLPRDRAQLF